MSAQNNGGPAFPQKEPLTSDCQGMTLRDYFAAKAMQEAMSWADIDAKEAAEEAYRFADAMLAERAK